MSALDTTLFSLSKPQEMEMCFYDKTRKLYIKIYQGGKLAKSVKRGILKPFKCFAFTVLITDIRYQEKTIMDFRGVRFRSKWVRTKRNTQNFILMI